MSFGFGVGDFLAVIKLANDIRKDFADAPEQFQHINTEIRNLAIVLGDVDVSLAAHDVSEDQNNNLKEIRESCRSVLGDTSKVRGKYLSLESKGGSLHERAKRVWKRVKWEPDDIRDLRHRITANIVTLNSFTGASIRDTVFRLEERQIRQESHEIFEWLAPLDASAQQANFINQRQAGTGQWLLDSTEYIKWKATKGEIMFCHGIPGVGKTILSSIVVENLQDTLGRETNVAICYLFFNFKRQAEQTLENMLFSLLKQMGHASESVPNDIRALFDQCKSKGSRSSREEIYKILSSVAGSFSRLLIIVDALDECQNSNGCQREFISHLIELQRNTGANILATSRPVPHIVERFKNFTSVKVHASEGDIHKYIESNLSNLPKFVSRDKNLQDEIKEAITKSVDGIFLLTKLHLASLEGKQSPRALRKTLETLATGNGAYEQAYQNTMLRISGQLSDQKELAMNTLMWIVHAKRPLTTVELQHALGVEIGDSEFFENSLPDLDDLVSACCGLVTIDEEGQIIRLIHYTAHEFFDRHGFQFFPSAEATITDTCVTYLSFDVFGSGPCQTSEDFRLRLANFPLYSYSSQYWGQHADSRANSASIRAFLCRPKHVEACGHALGALRYSGSPGENFSINRGSSNMTGLHLIAYFGLVGMASSILNDLLDPNIRTGKRRTPLWYATQNSHRNMICHELDRKYHPDVEDEKGRTPLHLAAENGHEAVVRLLLESGAQVDHTNNDDCTPLFDAAVGGHEAVMRLLLESGAQVDHTSSSGYTPLIWASQRGNEAAMRLLVESGAYVDHADSTGDTPLNWASRRGNEAAMRLLVESGAYVDHAGSTGDTPLNWASRRGNEAAMRLLVESGAYVDHADSKGHTPLNWASRRGDEAVVRLLLENGAQVDHADNHGYTPLLNAASRGDEAIVRLLLDSGAKVNIRMRHNGPTPLIMAARRGHWQILELLLAAGADHHATNVYGRTALIDAVIEDRPGAVDVLLSQNGLNPNAKDHWGSAAISFAARSGNIAIFRKLAALPNIDMFAWDSFGRTPLWWAQKHRNDTIAREIDAYQRSINHDMMEIDMLAEVGEPIRFSRRRDHCEVCFTSVTDSWFLCHHCADGLFRVCQECHGFGAHCLVESHQLVIRKLETIRKQSL